MGLLEWMFPTRCLACAAEAPGLCGACLAEAESAPVRPPPAGLDQWFSPFVYASPIREAVIGLKYRNRRVLVPVLAAALDSVLPPSLGVDQVTWVPTAVVRERGRGFDHAALLAREIARRRRWAVGPLLGRLDTRPQTGRTRSERLLGPALLAPGPCPPRVLVVDDVATTGASLDAAAGALRAEGCETVIGATVARTLLKARFPASDKFLGEGDASDSTISHQPTEQPHHADQLVRLDSPDTLDRPPRSTPRRRTIGPRPRSR